MIISCVKWGDKFNHEHVNRLYEMCIRNYTKEFRFICHTEDPTYLHEDIEVQPLNQELDLEKWWWKLTLFNEYDWRLGKEGVHIFFDLDVYIRSDPWNILNNINWERLTLVNCSYKTHVVDDRKHHFDVRINSSVAVWDADNPYIHSLWDKFYSGKKDYYLRKYAGIDRFIVHEGFDYTTFSNKLIQSYKYSNNVTAPIVTFEEVDYGSQDIKSWIEADRELL